MALSEEEQRRLDALEAALAHDDPKLASTLRGRPQFVIARRGAALGMLGFVIGMALLVLGISTFFLISIVGFVMMLIGSLAALSSVRRAEDANHSRHDPGRPPFADQAFVDMLEQQRHHIHPDDH